MKRFLPLLLLLSCSTSAEHESYDLGQYEYSAPMDVQPVYTWGDDMATEYADSLAERRLEDNTENAEFAQWADSMAKAEK